MKDLIDERNLREKIQRSIIKRANVNYISKEELERQKEDQKKAEGQQEAEMERSAEEIALEMERKKEEERQRLMEEVRIEASQPPSSRYGMKESDEVTKEQVEAILAEKGNAIDKLIEENQKKE